MNLVSATPPWAADLGAWCQPWCYAVFVVFYSWIAHSSNSPSPSPSRLRSRFHRSTFRMLSGLDPARGKPSLEGPIGGARVSSLAFVGFMGWGWNLFGCVG